MSLSPNAKTAIIVTSVVVLVAAIAVGIALGVVYGLPAAGTPDANAASPMDATTPTVMTVFPPGTAPTYHKVSKRDQFGHDLRSQPYHTTDQAKIACDLDPLCAGYNSARYTKTALPSITSSSLDLYFKQLPQAPSPAPTYTAHARKDKVGNDLLSKPLGSEAAAKAWCDRTPGCAGYNSGGFVKHGSVRSLVGSNLTFYAKNPVQGPPHTSSVNA